MFEAVTEFFVRFAEGFASPAGQIVTALIALTLVLVAYNALRSAMGDAPQHPGKAPKAAAPKVAPVRTLARAA